MRSAAQPAGIGEREDLGRAAATALAVDVLLAGDHVAVGEHGVEVTADRGRAEPDRLAELGGRRRTVLEQQAGDPGPGTTSCGRRRVLGHAGPTPAAARSRSAGACPASTAVFFTTPTLRISGRRAQTGSPVIHLGECGASGPGEHYVTEMVQCAIGVPQAGGCTLLAARTMTACTA